VFRHSAAKATARRSGGGAEAHLGQQWQTRFAGTLHLFEAVDNDPGTRGREGRGACFASASGSQRRRRSRACLGRTSIVPSSSRLTLAYARRSSRDQIVSAGASSSSSCEHERGRCTDPRKSRESSRPSQPGGACARCGTVRTRGTFEEYAEYCDASTSIATDVHSACTANDVRAIGKYGGRRRHRPSVGPGIGTCSSPSPGPRTGFSCGLADPARLERIRGPLGHRDGGWRVAAWRRPPATEWSALAGAPALAVDAQASRRSASTFGRTPIGVRERWRAAACAAPARVRVSSRDTRSRFVRSARECAPRETTASPPGGPPSG
jgi:hypothetical protein